MAFAADLMTRTAFWQHDLKDLHLNPPATAEMSRQSALPRGASFCVIVWSVSSGIIGANLASHWQSVLPCALEKKAGNVAQPSVSQRQAWGNPQHVWEQIEILLAPLQ